MQASSVIAFIGASMTSYAIQYTWTFRSTSRHIMAASKYIAMCLGGLIVNALAVFLARAWLSLSSLWTFILGSVSVILWNYAVARLWVFLR